MRTRFLLLIFLPIVVVSCKKETNDLSNADVRVKSIKGKDVLSFRYEDNRIVEVNGHNFFYDSQGKLIRSRRERVDSAIIVLENSEQSWSVYRNKLVFSYKWEGNHITEIKMDSSFSSVYRDGQLFSSTGAIGFTFCKFYYKEDRIDSIESYIQKNPLVSESIPIYVAFSYDEYGNIKQRREYYNAPIGLFSMRQLTFDYTYDNKLNPYNILYKQIGAIIPELINNNFSPNNVIRTDIRDNTGINGFIAFRYDYNTKGLPVKVFNDTDPMGQVVTFEYY